MASFVLFVLRSGVHLFHHCHFSFLVRLTCAMSQRILNSRGIKLPAYPAPADASILPQPRLSSDPHPSYLQKMVPKLLKNQSNIARLDSGLTKLEQRIIPRVRLPGPMGGPSGRPWLIAVSAAKPHACAGGAVPGVRFDGRGVAVSWKRCIWIKIPRPTQERVAIAIAVARARVNADGEVQWQCPPVGRYEGINAPQLGSCACDVPIRWRGLGNGDNWAEESSASEQHRGASDKHYVCGFAMSGSPGRCDIQCNTKAPRAVLNRSAGHFRVQRATGCSGNKAHLGL